MQISVAAIFTASTGCDFSNDDEMIRLLRNAMRCDAMDGKSSEVCSWKMEARWFAVAAMNSTCNGWIFTMEINRSVWEVSSRRTRMECPMR